MKNFNLTLYAVTDRACLKGRSLHEAVRSALKGGVTLVQLREKDMPTDEYIKEAKEIKKICREFSVPLLIDDNVEVCMLADADGVHLGQSDMPCSEARKLLGDTKIIGVTAKTVEQAKKAQEMGANYLGSGAIFGTSTKSDAVKLDMETLKSICASVSIPVCAIGGINKNNIRELKGSGISGAAVVSGIFGTDAESAAKELRSIMEEIL